VRLLLDTHILIWVLAGSPRIARVSQRLLDDDNHVYFSVASLWEIAIKSGLGKLDTDVVEIREAAKRSGFEELPVLGNHVERLPTLGLHHRDPFDRILVAQAQSEPMQLITADPVVALYGANIELI
jgi:PIN domain nuclease of toxin-antitoxin system